MIYENTYRVGARDTDPFNQCRPSSLMDFLQEAATEAAVELHVSREEMLRNYNVFWMLARIWYRLDKPLFWNDAITVRTWHRGGKGVSMYRDFDLLRNGEPVGEAVSLWVLADWETRKLFRLSQIREFDSTSGGDRCKKRTLSKLRVPVSLKPAGDRLLRYSDADVNGHVNNVRYADFTCDALELHKLGSNSFVSSLQLGYLKECGPGEILRISAGQGENMWYVQGDGEEGNARFDGALTLSPLVF